MHLVGLSHIQILQFDLVFGPNLRYEEKNLQKKKKIKIVRALSQNNMAPNTIIILRTMIF